MKMILFLVVVICIACSFTQPTKTEYNKESLIFHDDSLKQNDLSSYEIYKGDTINRRNKLGYLTGICYRFPDSTSIYTFRYYMTGETGKYSDQLWNESYYPNGILRSHYVRDTLTNYDENGNLKSLHEGSVYESHRITYFYENGNMQSRCFFSRHDMTNIGSELDSCICWGISRNRLENCP